MAIDVIWRGLAVGWVNAPENISGLSRMTFRNASMVFLLLSIASVAYAWLQQQTTPEGTQEKEAS